MFVKCVHTQMVPASDWAAIMAGSEDYEAGAEVLYVGDGVDDEEERWDKARRKILQAVALAVVRQSTCSTTRTQRNTRRSYIILFI